VNINDLTPLLERLAAELGTTVEMLWSVLLKQAAISATTNVVLSVLLVLIFIGCFQLVQRKTTVAPETEEHYACSDWEDEGKVIAWVILAAIAAIFLAIIIGGIHNVVSGYLNPQYWALKEILGHCK